MSAEATVHEGAVRRSDLGFKIRLNLRSVVGRAYPRVIGANREPSWVFFEVFLPLLGIAAYVFIYQAFYGARVAQIQAGICAPLSCSDALLQAGQQLNALVATVVLGGTMVAFWLNVLWSMASQLYWEKEIGNLQIYMMAPMSRMALLAGMAVGGKAWRLPLADSYDRALKAQRVRKARALVRDYLRSHPCRDCGERDPGGEAVRERDPVRLERDRDGADRDADEPGGVCACGVGEHGPDV